MRPPEASCLKTNDHDWCYGEQSMWCNRCWLVRPYKKGAHPALKKRPAFHKKPWVEAKYQPECCYCEQLFTELNPPTFDHIVPKSQGGTLKDGWVLACVLCNTARSSAPYEDYVDAVQLARLMALHEEREYRRPKTITYPDGTMYVSIATRAQRRAI